MSKPYKGMKIALSGGFDPVHIGHVRMFNAAKELVGNEGEVIVVINCDNWLIRKKGKKFMDQNERAEIISAFDSVDRVYIHESEDDHVADALAKIRPDIFGNGGDRKNENDIPESSICRKFNIEMIFNLGEGGKIQSSSWLLKNYSRST